MARRGAKGSFSKSGAGLDCACSATQAATVQMTTLTFRMEERVAKKRRDRGSGIGDQESVMADALLKSRQGSPPHRGRGSRILVTLRLAVLPVACVVALLGFPWPT